MVIGDVMLDAYLWGKVDRISPEAPVPIVSVFNKENRMGGAANVAINVSSLGAEPVLCSIIGNDTNGREFIELLQQRGMTSEGILQSSERPTTVKTRVIGNNYQMLRVDEERTEDIPAQERRQLIERIKGILSRKKIDVIIFEDYDKGVINRSLIEQVVRAARQKKIPVAVDPKKRNFNYYKQVTLFKPNLKELRDGLKLDLEKGNIGEISAAISRHCRDHQIDCALVTLSDKGILLSNQQGEELFPAHIRNIADVSGAGDTVISVAALCLAAGASPRMMTTLANLAGGLVCEKVGVVPVERDRLLDESAKLRFS